MDIKKIMKNKRGGNTLTGLVITLILVMGIFSTMFLFLQQKSSESGITLDAKYNDSYTRLKSAQDNLDENVHTIQTNLDDIKEADTAFQVAWNGLKGLGNTLILPISFVSSAIDTVSAIIIPLDFIPQNIKNLILLAIIAVVLFLVLANLKGEPKM